MGELANQLLQQQLLIAIGFFVALQHQMTFVRGRQVYIDHLGSGQFF